MNKINCSEDFTRKPSLTSGFTFVELLVVMAIFGLLATVVFMSLKSLRLKGADVTIMEDLDSLKKLTVEEFINLQGKYSTAAIDLKGDCSTFSTPNTIFANPKIQAILLDVKKQNGGAALYCELNIAGSAFAIATPLKTAGKYWCVDNAKVPKGTYGVNTDYQGLHAGSSAYAIWDGAYACS